MRLGPGRTSVTARGARGARGQDALPIGPPEGNDDDATTPQSDEPAGVGPRVGHLTFGSAALGTTVGLNAIGGFVFWAIAARMHPESAIGGSSALLQWTLLINLATSMGLPFALGRFASDDSNNSRRFFSWSLIYTFATSFVGATIFGFVAPASALAPLEGFGRGGAIVLMGLFVAGMSFANLAEIRLMSLRHWGWVVVRVGVLVAIRLALVPFDATSDPATWLFILAAGVPAASGYAAAAGLIWSGRPAPFGLPTLIRPYLRFATTNWWVVVATQGLAFAVPAVVSLRVNEDEFASFYVAWSIATIIFLVPQMIGHVLFTEGSKPGAQIAQDGRRALLLAAGFALVATFVVTIGRSLVSTVYGSEYAPAESLMPILCAAAIPWAVTTTAISLLRVHRRQAALALLALGFAAVTVPLAYVLTGETGITGGAWAWLIGHCVGAVFAGKPLIDAFLHADRVGDPDSATAAMDGADPFPHGAPSSITR